MVLSRIGYVALCVILPALWGLVIVAISNFMETRIKRRIHPKDHSDSGNVPPPLDYHI